MNTARRPLALACSAALLMALSACMSTSRWEEQESWAGKSVGSFPYHPLVYHLDLSTLAYQLHGQTLIWPFDPYYEKLGERRYEFMDAVRAWARRHAVEQEESGGLDAYRGPGVLAGFPDNPLHEPVIYRYAGLYPWSGAANILSDQWLEMKTPPAITGRLREAYVCYRPRPESAVTLERVAPRSEDESTDAPDVLLAFEGGTGNKGDAGQPPSRSIMGFVLVRSRAEDPDRYDVHIAFRGSRSGIIRLSETNWGGGTLSRLFGKKASGNPDWITDLGHGKERFRSISATGEVHRGFATAMREMLPTVFRCLREVSRLRPDAPPESIYVTGHSLGGALGQHFVSAVLMGEWYGPDGAGPAMPDSLRSWPWTRIKLITYGAPRAGDKTFARELTESRLESRFFSTWFSSKDHDALPPTDASIVDRLTDPSRPAGFRVLSSRDPITTEKWIGGKHAGATVYVDTPSNIFALDTAFHDPGLIREKLLEALDDERNPPGPVWDYTTANESSREDLNELAAEFKRYCMDRGFRFDQAAYDRAVALHAEISSPE